MAPAASSTAFWTACQSSALPSPLAPWSRTLPVGGFVPGGGCRVRAAARAMIAARRTAGTASRRDIGGSPARYAPRDYQTRPDRGGEKQDGRDEPGRSPVTARRLPLVALAVGDRLLEVEVDPGVRVAGQVAQRGQLLQPHQRRVRGERG